MKNLFIIRHSKANPHKNEQEDYDRTLDKLGKKEASEIGKWIDNINIDLDKIFSSSAIRAKQTSEIMVAQIRNAPEMVFDKNLYLADEYDLLEYIKLIDDKMNNIAIVGHEPGLKRLLLLLSGSLRPGLETALEKKFSTSTIAIVSINIFLWSAVNEREGVLSEYFNPK